MVKVVTKDRRKVYILDDLEKIAEVVSAGGDEYVIKSDVTLGTLVQKIKARLKREIEGLQKPHK